MKKLNYNPFGSGEPEKPRTRADVLEATVRPRTAADELTEGPPRTMSLVVPGYGGITVVGANTPTEAMLHVLDLLVRERVRVDDTLVAFGVLLAQLAEHPVQGFCLRRSEDGWSLAVPEAPTREQALLQITQALLELARTPFGPTLRAARITPYRE